MINRKKRERILAFILCTGLLTAFACPPGAASFAAGEETDATGMSIDSVEAFVEFGKNCTTEAYTRGKSFRLTRDIDLSGTEFSPIPIFAGTFEGGGYTISGFSYDQAGTNIGLFRYVEEGAVINKLLVSGDLNPTGSRTTVGGIAGVNRGGIYYCQFFGSVTAIESAGGIVGSNEESGHVENSESTAKITGNKQIGGIAGSNKGTILNCINRGDVNNSKDGIAKEDNATDYNLDESSLRETLAIEKVNDAGGIAGYSTGTIQGCQNYGVIGYSHVGYHIGGIAGRQSGLMYQCVNYGAVTGRKDIGGIAGQFEPYLTVLYREDTLDQLGNELDTLSNIEEDMFQRIHDTTDTAFDDVDQVKEVLRGIREYTRDRKGNWKLERDEFDEKAGRQLDILEEKIDAIDIDFSSESAHQAFRRIKKNIQRIRMILNQFDIGSGEIPILNDEEDEDFMDELGDAYLSLLELSSCIDDVVTDTGIVLEDGFDGIDDGMIDLKDSLGAVRDEARLLSDLVRERKNVVYDNLDTYDDTVTEKLDSLYQQLDTMLDDLQSGKEQTRDEQDRLHDQVTVIDDVLSDGRDQVRDDIDQVIDEDDWVFDDLSDNDDVSLEPGNIVACLNHGEINADYQSGGVAGMIGFEMSTDPDLDLDTSGDRSLDMERYAKATIINCWNDGAITAEKNYAGGIAGKSSVGALIANQNYGNATVVDGNYAGGIAGYSKVCRNNYNLNKVSGTDYLGGITGWGRDIKNNYGRTTIISDHGEWYGSIAGFAVSDGEIADNYYVDEQLGAIDGISRNGEAYGISYAELIQLEHIPEEFSNIKVTFLAEDQVITIIPCQYGQALSVSDLPKAPEKEGYYCVWEDIDLSSVKENIQVHAIYQPWQTTIASADDSLPFLLAEGHFRPEVKLKVWDYDGDSLDTPMNYKLLGTYECMIEDQNLNLITEPMVYHVRVKDWKRASDIGIVKNGSIELQDSRRDGDYLIFQMERPGTFAVLQHKNRCSAIVVTILTAGMAAAGILLILHKRKKLTQER